MKISWVLILFLFVVVGCQQNTAPTVAVQQPVIDRDSFINVYFCPQDSCIEVLLEFVMRAEKSLHCAFYDIDVEELLFLLSYKASSIDVKLVVDNTNYEEVNYLSFAKKDSSKQLMHNKFCIADKKVVLTGSTNPTFRGLTLNNNNILIINSEYLAENYENEFEELWNSTFGTGRKVGYPVVYLNKTMVENYFCPEDNCSEKVIELIKKADKSIYFMTFSFTHPKIATELVIAMKRGIDVRGVFEKSQQSSYSKFALLDFQGTDVIFDKNKYNMHHKVFIIDNKTVITGSFNPTKNADYRNDENILIIHDKEIAKKYLHEFSNLL